MYRNEELIAKASKEAPPFAEPNMRGSLWGPGHGHLRAQVEVMGE
jgi:hypothetical protein